MVLFLSAFSILNAVYTFYRKRSYRLFESAIDVHPHTQSAKRVRVDSSPMSSSPLQFLSKILRSTSSDEATPLDPENHVWEIAAWDPLPVCLRLFCLFSPGHILIYWLYLPTQNLDTRPSMTVIKTVFLQIIMTMQLLLLQNRFTQQMRDSSIIQKEVMNEYDTKFVHHRLNPVVRDVGTQYTSSDTGSSHKRRNSVVVYKPTIILKRSFRTNPNPNYARHFDPDNILASNQRHDVFSPTLTPSMKSSDKSVLTHTPPSQATKQPQFRRSLAGIPSMSTSISTSNNGGTLGIYSHANSPLRKNTNLQETNADEYVTPRNSFTMASREIRDQRDRINCSDKGHNEGSGTTANHHNLFGNVVSRDDSGVSSFSSNPSRSKQKSIIDQAYGRVPSRFY